MSEPNEEVQPAEHGVGCYVYAVVDGDATGVRGRPGIEPGGPVDAVTVGDLTAVVSAVDLDAMRDGGASTDLDEDSWLARAVRRHEQVVMAAFRSAATVPMRFGIVHADRASVERLLTMYGAELRDELARLGEAGEWNLKAFADRDVLAETAGGADADGQVVDSGRGYLLRERERREVDTRIRETIAERAATLVDQVSSVARELAPLPFGGDESRRGVVAAVCLVDRAAEDRLTCIVERYAEAAGPQGVTVELTGPWPPYHFTSLRLGAGND
jgi:hypothetical protein